MNKYRVVTMMNSGDQFETDYCYDLETVASMLRNEIFYTTPRELEKCSIYIEKNDDDVELIYLIESATGIVIRSVTDYQSALNLFNQYEDEDFESGIYEPNCYHIAVMSKDVFEIIK